MSHARLRFLAGLACTVLSASSFAQPNIRIHPDSTLHQINVRLASNRANPFVIFATAGTVRTNPSWSNGGGYFSTDGGAGWFGTDTFFVPQYSLLHSAAPTMGREGFLYLFGLPSSGGVAVAFTTNLGVTWSGLFTVAMGSSDNPSGFVNDVLLSPYYRRVYATWTNFSLTTPAAVISRSTDDGLTWSARMNIISPAGGHYQQGVSGTTGGNGDAYICWANPTAGSPYASEFVGFARSTDGGVTWLGSTTSYTCCGIRGTLPGKGGIRVEDFPRMAVDRSGGGRNGWIYIITPEKNLAPAGTDPDIVLHRSTDGGISWSMGIRVNQDGLNNGKTQYAPSIAVDDSGRVCVTYYDDRNTSMDSSAVCLSISTDGGSTWRDTLVTDHRFKPKLIPSISGNLDPGERTATIVAGENVVSFWIDDVTGTNQVWMTSVSTLTAVGEGSDQLPSSVKLEQNYPNPFNPSTEIGFRIAECGWTTLKVFDMLGREVATLVNELKQPGTYTVPWNTSGMATGVYVYRLQAGNFTRQRKMLLVK